MELLVLGLGIYLGIGVYIAGRNGFDKEELPGSSESIIKGWEEMVLWPRHILEKGGNETSSEDRV